MVIRLSVYRHILLLGVYRCGSYPATIEFFNELTSVFDELCMHRCPILLFGDFNVHIDVATDPTAKRMAKLLRSSRCVQHVVDPTHKDGHTLDLIITSEDDEIADVKVGERISDHSLLTFTIPFSLKPVTHATWTI